MLITYIIVLLVLQKRNDIQMAEAVATPKSPKGRWSGPQWRWQWQSSLSGSQGRSSGKRIPRPDLGACGQTPPGPANSSLPALPRPAFSLTTSLSISLGPLLTELHLFVFTLLHYSGR
ncbi:hypothetical protein J6590_054083 [Homalodisca vitripennis]|nr:hypothetical protein J6590_054083 [Homalodisca vitripennis]